MSSMLGKRSIMKNFVHVGSLTLLSRGLGIVREILQSRFLGVGVLSDAFITAFKIPNFLRQIFAEGALSASFIPSYVKILREKDDNRSASLVSMAFLFFQGILVLLCLLVVLFPDATIKIISPGFTLEQHAATVPYLRILFPFILLISSASILSGALQGHNHFLVHAAAPVMINVVWVSTLLYCLSNNASVEFLCWGVIAGGVAQLLAHIAVFYGFGLWFGPINRQAFRDFYEVLKKFLPCLMGVSVVEINFFIDTILCSYLPVGTPTLFYLAYRWSQLASSIYSVGLTTVLLPHFSRLGLYAPSRLRFYLLEVTKFISWLVLPTMLFLNFVAEPIFSILMLKDKGTPEQIYQASWLLIIMNLGLLFFSVNKVLMRLCYAMHDTITPTTATIASTFVNVIISWWGLYYWGAYAMVFGTVAAAVVVTIVCLLSLIFRHNIPFYGIRYLHFLVRSGLQLAVFSLFFYAAHELFVMLVRSTAWSTFFLGGLGYWMFTIPLFCFTMLLMFYTRRLFGVKVYFLN